MIYLDVNEPVGEVEVELSVEGNPEGCQDEHCCVPGARKGLSRKKSRQFQNNWEIIRSQGRPARRWDKAGDWWRNSGRRSPPTPWTGGRPSWSRTCCGSPWTACIADWVQTGAPTIPADRGHSARIQRTQMWFRSSQQTFVICVENKTKIVSHLKKTQSIESKLLAAWKS